MVRSTMLRLVVHLVVHTAVFATAVSFAQPPVPYVPPEQLDERRQISQTDIRFCVWNDSPLKEFEVRIATEIAHALLLEPVIHEIFLPAATNDADFWQTMYTALTNDCEALMGYILVPEQLPTWMAASRPYYSVGTTLVVVQSEIASLAAVPRGDFIGTLLSTVGDFQLIGYLQTLPENQRWRRLPFDSPAKLIDSLVEGTVSAALMPEAVLHGLLEDGVETNALRTVSTSPLNIPQTLFSVGMRASESSLRTIVDEAIVALIDDGTVERLLDEMSLPGHPGSLGR